MKRTNRFAIITYGCAANQADSNFMSTILQDADWKEVDVDGADIVIVNTCTVKGPTESKIMDFVKKISKTKEKSKIIIAGCLPSDSSFIKKYSEYSLLNPYSVHKILELAKKIAKSNKPIHVLDFERFDKTKLYYKTKGIAIIQPLIGCLGKCTFCKTRFAKPLFQSYPLENIISRIEYYLQNGAKEFWISCEDNGAYGYDIGLTYIDLLNEIEKKFKGKAMFRFGMANPWLLKKHTHELIEFFDKTKAFYKFLHIPVQSASDSVLKEMKRPYTLKQLNSLFDSINKKFSYKELTIATDVIVGFPHESDKDFEKTYNFIKGKEFLIVNVSQFWPRPFTEAQKMKQLTTEVKKDRSRRMSVLGRAKAIRILKSYVGKTIEVYPNEYDVKGNTLSRTRNYVSVIIKNKKVKLFDWKKVKIKKVENYHLIGSI